MRRLLVPLAALLALAATAAAAAPAAVSPNPAVIITVRSIETSSTPDDRPPTGPSKGDRFLLRDNLENVARQFGKRKGAVVGTDAGLLTLTSKTEGTVVGFATLPGGRVRFHGVVHLKGASVPFTVDGGTGRYAHAHGTMVVGTGDEPLNTYRLTLAGTSGGGGPTV
jgi:hypothetical protein